MCKASAIGHVAGPCCSDRDGARTDARTMDDADGPEGQKVK